MDLNFLYTCKLNCLVPNFVKFRLYKKSLYHFNFYHNATNELLNLEINQKEKISSRLQSRVLELQNSLKNNLSFLEIIYIHSCLSRYINAYSDRINAIHQNKLSKFGVSQPDFKFIDQVVHNYSSYTLSKKEKFLLSLGLDFCLPTTRPKYVDFFLAFEKLANTLSFFSDHNAFTSFRKECSHLAYKTYTSHWDKNWFPFLNKKDIDILKELGNNKNVIVTKPDKGNGVVIMNREDYVEKMLHILEDNSKFQIVDDINEFKLIYKIEDKINRFLSQLKAKNSITKDMYNELHVSGSSFGKLYGSPKVHKGPSLPLRPIMAAYNLPNYRLAKCLVPLLAPLTTNSYSIKNSFEFANFITTQCPNQYLVSFDVESLFTNIPIYETIDIILDKLFPNDDTIYCGFSKLDFKKLLELSVSDNHFLFNSQIYKQLDGMAMGSPLGPTFANIFMNNLETQFLENCELAYKPTFYKRYIDDTIAGFKDAHHSQLFLQYINQSHPNIKFTIDTENNNCLNFLDITISRIADKFNTNVYRKSCFTGLGLNFYSFCPYQYKFNSCKTLINRAYKICSSWLNFSEELKVLDSYFLQNNYPSHIFPKYVKAYLNNIFQSKAAITTVPKKVIYTSFPYLGSKTKILQSELTKILNKYYPYLNVKLAYHNSFKISSFFHFKDSLMPLMRHNVVYSYSCPKCDLGRYLGCTTRLLRARICGHMGISHRTLDNVATQENSAIRTHSKKCKVAINFKDFKILYSSSSKQSLLIAESLLIKQLSPKLNSDQSSTPLYIA